MDGGEAELLWDKNCPSSWQTGMAGGCGSQFQTGKHYFGKYSLASQFHSCDFQLVPPSRGVLDTLRGSQPELWLERQIQTNSSLQASVPSYSSGIYHAPGRLRLAFSSQRSLS